MTSLKKNVLYSSVLTVSSYIFPILTFPYVTRILGVNSIGICNFVDSIVQYFIYFSMMGITTIGIREIARTKGNPLELSRVYSSLLFLNLVTTVIAIFLLLSLTLFVPYLQVYKYLFYIGAAKVLANTLLVEWLFKGLEDFKYITARTIAVRSLYVLSIFIFIRNADDYFLYFFLTSLMVVVNALINLQYSRKFVRISFKNIAFTPYLKSFVILGVYNLLTSMYTTFNVAYLGFISNTIQVGYYTTATKLYAIIMSFFTAFTGVMMPRMSVLLSEGKYDEFKKLTSKSVEALFAFAIPLIVISECCAPQIIQIIAGDGYEGAILPMRIVMPLMLIIGYEQILVLQILSPMNKDSAILRNSILGAIVAIVFNIVLVPLFASKGTAVVWIMSELAVMFSANFYVHKYVGYKIPLMPLLKRLVLTTPIMVVAYFTSVLMSNTYVSLVIVVVVVFMGCSILELFILKNDLIRNNLISKILFFRK